MTKEIAEGDKTIRIPTWCITLAKICTPALMVLGASYMLLQQLEFRVNLISPKVDQNQEKLGAVQADVRELEHKNGDLEKDLNRGMDRVNKTLEKIYDKVEKIDVAQQEAKTDIRLIQQRLPAKEIP